jgi:drug/metabolite transporter (DMT)-like permease
MLCSSLVFALMGALARSLGPYCDWQFTALSRAAVALILAGGLTRLAGAQLVLWKPRTLWLRSLAGSISLICAFYCFPRLPLSDILALTNIFPVWVALLSWPVLGERPSLSVWLSVASGIAGVMLIQQPHFAQRDFTTLVALAASFASAVAMLGLHRLRQVDPRAIVAHFSGVSLLFCLASLVVFERKVSPQAGTESYVAALLLGVGLTATVGQLLLTRAFAAGSPSRVSVVGLTQVVFALILDVLLWGDTITSQKVVGMLLVLTPTAWLMTHGRHPPLEREG